MQHLRVMAAGWHQIDADRWPELYVVTDLPEVLDGARLLDNDGGSLSQLDGTGTEVDLAGMGIGAGDLDDDGLTDFVVPGIDEIAVLQSGGGDRWVDWSAARGLVPDGSRGQSVGWGGELADLDNDGHLDLVMGFGSIPGSAIDDQPDEIYRNLADGSFDPVGADWGFDDPFWTRGSVVGGPRRQRLARRRQARAGGAGWWYTWPGVARPTGSASASPPTTPTATASGRGSRSTWLAGTCGRQISAGSTSYNAAGPPEAHFGLGQAERVEAIRVTWPTGTTTHHPSVAADQWVEVRFGPDP